MRYAPLLLTALLTAGIGHATVPSTPTATTGVSAAELVVRKQVKAYNNGDLQAFLACYAPDIKMYDLGSDTPFTNGIADMEAGYRPMFEALPNLRAVITSRIVEGSYVVDHETVYFGDGSAPMRAIAIYEVKNNLITRVWFNPMQ